MRVKYLVDLWCMLEKFNSLSATLVAIEHLRVRIKEGISQKCLEFSSVCYHLKPVAKYS